MIDRIAEDLERGRRDAARRGTQVCKLTAAMSLHSALRGRPEQMWRTFGASIKAPITEVQDIVDCLTIMSEEWIASAARPMTV